MKDLRFTHLARLGACLSGAFLFLLIDLLTKAFFFGQSKNLLGSFVRLEEHRNFGISFNMPIPAVISIVLALFVISWCLQHLQKQQTTNAWQVFWLSMLIGGVLGNMFDRITLGYVRDWLALYRSILNLADIFILVGMLMFYRTERRHTTMAE